VLDLGHEPEAHRFAEQLGRAIRSEPPVPLPDALGRLRVGARGAPAPPRDARARLVGAPRVDCGTELVGRRDHPGEDTPVDGRSTGRRPGRYARRRMTLDKKIAVLGAGNMAGALIRGLLGAHACQPDQLVATDVRPERLADLAKLHGIQTSTDNAKTASWADVVVLATKPQVFDRLLAQIAGAVRPETLVVSIAAGVSTGAMEGRLPAGTRVVRTMPNTPALVGAGATAIAAGTHATDDDVRVVRAIFDSVGISVVLEEALLDAATGLSGSGPAYIFLIIEALADAGVKVGLHRDSAQLLAAQTVLGSAKLLIETGEHPGRLKDMVTSPGGTAIAGLHTLEAGGLRTTLIDAVEAATERATELGAAMDHKLGRG